MAGAGSSGGGAGGGAAGAGKLPLPNSIIRDTRGARARGHATRPNITFAALERALRAAADAHVVHLPSRLRVIDVPAGVERRYDDFCARDAEFGENWRK